MSMARSGLAAAVRPSMTLQHVTDGLRQTVRWPGYDHSWFERELAGVGMLVEAAGGTIHAVVVGMHQSDGTTYVDFSPCSAPCGAHGLPPHPRGELRPCITFIAVTGEEQVYFRDETGAPSVAEA